MLQRPRGRIFLTTVHPHTLPVNRRQTSIHWAAEERLSDCCEIWWRALRAAKGVWSSCKERVDTHLEVRVAAALGEAAESETQRRAHPSHGCSTSRRHTLSVAKPFNRGFRPTWRCGSPPEEREP
jgi:hypothetical protein